MSGCRPTLVVSYNGEIYNFPELRRELEGHGYSFKSRTDTEVLCNAIDHWGITEATRRLNGIFAFAVVDEDARTVTLARDRYGIKPMYYWFGTDCIVFASEIKAIIATGLYDAQVEIEAIPEYLMFGSVAGERTLFKGVQELLPGHLMEFRLPGGQTSQKAYHELKIERRAINRGEAVSRFRSLLDAAVLRQLRSDVPLGSLNSGGLDSSYLSTLAVRNGCEGIRTYNASYGGAFDGMYDESRYAKELSLRIRSHHREVSTSPEDFFALIGGITWLNDEPLSHPNSIPLFKVFRAARADGMKVMLSGEGADEVLAGYDFFTDLLLLQRLSHIPKFAMGPLCRLWSKHHRSIRLTTLGNAWHRFGMQSIAGIVRTEAANTLHPEARLGAYRQKILEKPHDDIFELGTEYVQRVYLPPLLQRCDRMSMASGVECRVPFLDNEVTDFANRLPRTYKRRLFPKRLGKIILRKCASSDLPASILHRAKYGFAVPLGPWFSQTAAGREALSLLREPRSRNRPWRAEEPVNSLDLKTETATNTFGRRSFSLLTLELWARQFLDGERETDATLGFFSDSAKSVM